MSDLWGKSYRGGIVVGAIVAVVLNIACVALAAWAVWRLVSWVVTK